MTLIIALALGVSACAPRIDTTRPAFAFASSWQNSIKSTPRLADEKNWWRGLQDPVLDALVARALTDSPDLAAAQLRAQAAWQETGAIQGLRTLESGAQGRRNSGRFKTEDSVIGAALNLQMIFDLGRGREAQRLGAIAQAAIAHAEQSAAQLLLIGEISNSYIALRTGQQQLALIDRGRARQRQVLGLARTLLAEGEGTRIDTLRSEARLASLDANRYQVEALIEREILRLSILTGAAPGTLQPDLATALRQTKAQPRPRLLPDPTVPADLVRNRPDLRVAEARYDAARAALGGARAALYPGLSLSGTIDVREIKAGGALTRGGVSSLGPSLRLPVFPLAATRAAVDAADTRVEAAYQSWHAATLKALFEVESALLDYRKVTQNEQAISRAVSLQTQAYSLLHSAVREGAATFGELAALDSELLDLETEQVSVTRQRAESFIALNIRLGMGAAPY